MKLEKHKERLIDFVFDLYNSKVDLPSRETEEPRAKKRKTTETIDDTDDEDDTETAKTTLSSKDATEKSTCFDGCDAFDDLMVEFGDMNEDEEQITADEIHEKEQQEMKVKIKNEIDAFVYYCENIDWWKMLKNYPMKPNQEIDRIRFASRNPYYYAMNFSVLRWWEFEGAARYPHLATAALIILGKPYSNGFQERVFSRGTYMDGKLRRTLKQERQELQVLDSLNGNLARDIMKQLQQHLPKEEEEKNFFKTFFETNRKEVVISELDVPNYDINLDSGERVISYEEPIDGEDDEEQYTDDDSSLDSEEEDD